MPPKMKRLSSCHDKYGAEFSISFDDLKVKARNKILKDLGGKPNADNLAGVHIYIQWFKEDSDASKTEAPLAKVE